MPKTKLIELEPLEVTAWRRKEGRGKDAKRLPWPEIAGSVGVYAILHRPSNSVYIGYTAGKQGFKARWKNHKRLLFILEAHHCAPFQDFVKKNKLRARDFELLVLSAYPAIPRTQTLADALVKEEVLFWDLAQERGYTMLCERPTGAKRKYQRVTKKQIREAKQAKRKALIEAKPLTR